MTIRSESTDDPECMRLITNLRLSEDALESYPDRASGEEGSPLAQFLFGIDGLAALDIDGQSLLLRRTADVEWHDLIDEVTTALKEFFL